MLRTFIQFGLTIIATGCGTAVANRPVATATTPETQLTPISRLAEPVYPDQMEALSADERKAVTIATAALRQRNLLAVGDENLAFAIARSGMGWDVMVSPFSRDERSSQPLFMPGNFVVVTITSNWQVVRVTGGA